MFKTASEFAIQIVATLTLTGFAGALLFAAADYATRGVVTSL